MRWISGSAAMEFKRDGIDRGTTGIPGTVCLDEDAFM
jgi:hypothetical protein